MVFNITFFSGVRDNHVNTRAEYSWEDFRSLLSPHTPTADKDTVLVCPARFIEGGDDPVRRCSANVLEYSMVALDIDGDYSITAFKQRFRRWRYAAYTTFSHRSAKKRGADAFRAFFPLAEPAPAATFRSMRPEIKAWAGIGDRSQLDLSRGFYMPSCPADRLVLAESWRNDGDVVDWSGWAAAAAKRIELENAVPPPEIRPMTDDSRQRLLDNLRGRYVGQEPIWWRVGIAMASNGFSLDDFKAVTLGGMMRQKTASDCDSKWRHCLEQVRAGTQISLGFLVNLAKGRG